jgi:Flp pilus assembly pilin Flp
MQWITAPRPTRQWLPSFELNEEAAGLVEYALIMGVIAIGAIIAMIFLREQLSNIFHSIGNGVQNTTCTGPNQQGQCP